MRELELGVAAQGVGLIATQEFPLPTPRNTSSPWIQLALDQLQIELEAPSLLTNEEARNSYSATQI